MASNKMEKGLPLPVSAAQVGTTVGGRTVRRRVMLFVLFALGSFVILNYYDDGKYGKALLETSRKKMPEQAAGQEESFHVALPGYGLSKGSDGGIAQIKNAAKDGKGGDDGKSHVESDGKHRAGDSHFEPTDALRSFANKLGLTLSEQGIPTDGEQTLPPRPPPSSQAPTSGDRVLLLLSAMKHQAFKVPSEISQRAKELLPDTVERMASVLRSLSGKGAFDVQDADDAKLYLDSHDVWTSKHQQQSPLTVFSKSYCPYSRKAKELLTKLGAKFDVYEVDLRSDGDALQQSLREISGHATFPTIFLREKLIGGSDDLAQLESMGILHGVLQAAGVKFTP